MIYISSTSPNHTGSNTENSTHKPDVVELTKALIAIPSVSSQSNGPITDYLEQLFKLNNFETERLSYIDKDGVDKHSLVAKKGQGRGGIGFFSHSDTVPGQERDWAAFTPTIEDGKLLGRGSCDMKGPLAATICAAIAIDESKLAKPVYVVVAADEEVGFGGCKQIHKESKLLGDDWPEVGVVAEPTSLQTVYAHKGAHMFTITAYGEAAHTSTAKGTSANLLMAPFLAEIAELAKLYNEDKSYQNDEFEPPTNGLNLTLTDYGTAANVTAAKTTCRVNFRWMPNARAHDILDDIQTRAEKYGFEVDGNGMEAFYVDKDSDVVKLSLKAAGDEVPITVPYGTEALVYQDKTQLVILGPGDIAHAHTVGEFVLLEELERAVDIYNKMIVEYCC